ncbi:MAG: chorismate synthase [Flavobacteriales bacterium]
MPGNTFGTLFRLTTFGESHGPAIGGVLDGMPAGMKVEIDFVQYELDRRKPGQSALTSPRKESDRVEILSGVFNQNTLGTPIGFVLYNEDQQSEDYDVLAEVYRPGHADEVWDKKFGIRDYRGGGRSSARETAARVVGGAFAKMLLAKEGVSVQAYVSSVKDIEVSESYDRLDLVRTEDSLVRCPHEETSQRMIQCIEQARDGGDSVGGVITCVCKGMLAGWGEPVFDKLHAVMAHAMLSINATQGFEILGGFDSTRLHGSENNLRSTGVSGGISTGHDFVFRVAFKPVSTIRKKQEARNAAGDVVSLEAAGRHDPCVLPRAVPIVEAMAALTLADMHLLWHKPM